MGWTASNPDKRWTELFFLGYSPLWIALVASIVAFRLYENFSEMDYLVVGLVVGLPCLLWPLIGGPKEFRKKPLLDRYWLKANVWLGIFSFVGNYFWTHYFYQVLGASYTMRTYDLNQVPMLQGVRHQFMRQVPIFCYLVTHAYFCLYHSLSNMLIRKVRTSLDKSDPVVRNAAEAIAIFVFSYFTAYMETYTIEEFPLYSFVERAPMYTVGSLFYAIYFFVSFPMFYRMDEDPKMKWSVANAITSSLAASMLVTILLDLWRLALGPLVSMGPELKAHGPPWLMATRNSRAVEEKVNGWLSQRSDGIIGSNQPRQARSCERRLDLSSDRQESTGGKQLPEDKHSVSATEIFRVHGSISPRPHPSSPGSTSLELSRREVTIL